MQDHVMVQAIAKRLSAADHLIQVAKYTPDQTMALTHLLVVQGDLDALASLLEQASFMTIPEWEFNALCEQSVVLRRKYEEVKQRV